MTRADFIDGGDRGYLANRTQLAPDTCRVAKKPERPKPISWKIYKTAAKAMWIGEVEAPDEAAAIENSAIELGKPSLLVEAHFGLFLRQLHETRAA